MKECPVVLLLDLCYYPESPAEWIALAPNHGGGRQTHIVRAIFEISRECRRARRVVFLGQVCLRALSPTFAYDNNGNVSPESSHRLCRSVGRSGREHSTAATAYSFAFLVHSHSIPASVNIYKHFPAITLTAVTNEILDSSQTSFLTLRVIGRRWRTILELCH